MSMADCGYCAGAHSEIPRDFLKTRFDVNIGSIFMTTVLETLHFTDILMIIGLKSRETNKIFMFIGLLSRGRYGFCGAN